MFTLTLFASAFVINEAAITLVSDVRRAMKRADLSLDYVARATGVPLSRLSDQLNGKTPFTALWRFFAADDMRVTDFAHEFFALHAARIDRMCVSVELGQVLTRIDRLLEEVPKVMAKAELAVAQTRRKAVC